MTKGTSPMAVDNVMHADSLGELIPAKAMDGTVRVSAPMWGHVYPPVVGQGGAR